MAAICPTVTAHDEAVYRSQMDTVSEFAQRVHIDLMDGDFAPTVSVPLETIWWPTQLAADVHIMYRRPGDYLDKLIDLKPNTVVIHAEADVDHAAFAAKLRDNGIKAGLALLQETAVSAVEQKLDDFDHIMIFSGNLGHQGGGKMDFGLLDKVRQARQIKPGIEVAWDGGIDDTTAKQLADGGVDVLNVGSFIHKSNDPAAAFRQLESLLGSR